MTTSYLQCLHQTNGLIDVRYCVGRVHFIEELLYSWSCVAHYVCTWVYGIQSGITTFFSTTFDDKVPSALQDLRLDSMSECALLNYLDNL